MSNISDYENLGFNYRQTKARYVDKYINGKWQGGKLTNDANLLINECAGGIQYAQTAFEGLKAYKNSKNEVLIFRPDENAKRFYSSCERLVMPTYNIESFIDAVKAVVSANKEYIPPYGSNGALYIRPFMFATGPMISVAPSKEFEFRVFSTPVGNYFLNGLKPLNIIVTDYDRAAPNGTGSIKGGLNYAMSLYAQELAHKNGYDENLYLDPKEKLFIEETGGSNVFFIDKKDTLIVPKSNSILPSITRKSIVAIAKDILNLSIEERPVKLTELSNFKEASVCGTAAVIAPIGQIVDKNQTYIFNYGDENFGKISKELYNTYNKIKYNELDVKSEWIFKC